MDVGAVGEGRQWSWAASEVEADARRRDAEKLVGQSIQAVRYYMLDHRRDDLRPDLIGDGPRVIDGAAEWSEPMWLCDGFDAVDYGFEVTTDSGAVFSLTWDPPSDREGIGMQPVPLLGSAVMSDADVAIWDVGERSASWAPMIGRRVAGVNLHYFPWDEPTGGLWCPRITFHGEDACVEVLMGECRDGVLVSSSDNVAVLHPGASLPAWVS